MIEIDKVEVIGWEHVIRGMRNPKNSWDRSDSCVKGEYFCSDWCGKAECHNNISGLNLGPNDHGLMLKLSNGGPVHAKYRRMVTVYLDITAPLYWWKEFDTYKVGTVANSCSTMHKIHEKEFTLEDFSCEHLLGGLNHYDEREVPYLDFSPERNGYCTYSAAGILECCIIPMLNICREYFIETKDKKYWWQMIQLLPSSYNQRRTIMLNYEVLANIYKWRKDHKLDEWREFCKWIETLPYSEIITNKVTEGDH